MGGSGGGARGGKEGGRKEVISERRRLEKNMKWIEKVSCVCRCDGE